MEHLKSYRSLNKTRFAFRDINSQQMCHRGDLVGLPARQERAGDPPRRQCSPAAKALHPRTSTASPHAPKGTVQTTIHSCIHGGREGPGLGCSWKVQTVLTEARPRLTGTSQPLSLHHRVPTGIRGRRPVTRRGRKSTRSPPSRQKADMFLSHSCNPSKLHSDVPGKLRSTGAWIHRR